jgi:hypothetical protein
MYVLVRLSIRYYIYTVKIAAIYEAQLASSQNLTDVVNAFISSGVGMTFKA